MSTRHNLRGFSLIELLVALAIGSFLIIGAVTMQANTRKTFTINEQQARLQETARYVISVIEPELQLAGNYGFTNRPEDIRYNGINTPIQNMRTWSAQVGGLPAVLEECGRHYGVDVISTVTAANNSYTLTCAAQGGGHNGTSDTLTIRHAGQVPITVVDGSKYQIQTTRLAQFENRLFIATTAPTTSAIGDREVRDMFVNTYYVAINADNRPGIPALRVKSIGTNATGTAPQMNDQEVIRGVEDIQVEFGIDPGIDMDGDGDGEVINAYTTRYVAPNAAIVPNAQISAVRIWVRVRAEDAEQGFVNNRTYSYAGVNFTANDGFRRVLMSRTVFLRNARGMAF